MLLALPVQAAVYKWVDEAGNVHYGDTPPIEGARQLELPEYTRYAPRPLPSSGAQAPAADQEKAADEPASEAPAPAEDEGPDGYQRLEILQPEQNGTVRSSEGLVEVQLAIEPPLGKAHYITFTLDGARASQPVQGSSFTLSDVERGSHVLQASVVDAGGRVMLRSDTIRFTMRQDSIQMRAEPEPPIAKPPSYRPEYGAETPNYAPEQADYTPDPAAPDYSPKAPDYTPPSGGSSYTPGQTNPAFAPNYTPQ
jgi:hypothetical protein